jgi:hypothetical protein
MPRAKETFSRPILGARAIGWQPLSYGFQLF